MCKFLRLPVLVASLWAPALFSHAATDLALGKPVIDYSNQFNNNFAAQFVTDGSTVDTFATNYWVTADNQGVGAFFTVDLQGILSVGELDLRNTHNDQFRDRGTAGFSIFAATAVDGANKLIAPQLILSGTLTDTHTLGAGATIPPDQFTSANGLTTGDYRYLQFIVNTLPGYTSGTNAAGLNEFEVYAVPEPSPSLLLGTGLLTALLVLRRRTTRGMDRVSSVRAV